jgi:hypothetical protein
MSVLKLDQIQSRTGGNITSPNTIISPGNVIQVVKTQLGVQGTTSSAANVNSSYALTFTTTTWTDTSLLSLTITPKASNSLMMLYLSIFVNQDSSDAQAAPSIRIVRGSTVIWQPQTNATGPYGLTYSTSSQHYEQPTIMCSDIANTLSPITYSLQYRTYGGVANGRLFGYPGADQWSPINTFTVMEIAQ